MATVLIKRDNIKVKAPAGTTMRKIAIKTGSSLEFGCRVGDCGSCVVTVEAGGEFLSPLNDKEKHMLEIIQEDPTTHRLMCQVTVISDDGDVVIA